MYLYLIKYLYNFFGRRADADRRGHFPHLNSSKTHTRLGPRKQQGMPNLFLPLPLGSPGHIDPATKVAGFGGGRDDECSRTAGDRGEHPTAANSPDRAAAFTESGVPRPRSASRRRRAGGTAVAGSGVTVSSYRAGGQDSFSL